MLKLTGKIKIITGMHIGKGKNSIGIGELDAPVIKDREKKYPYIPGSSLKGKIRSLLAGGKEIRDKYGNPGELPEIQKAFGMPPKDNDQLQIGVGQVIFRDAFLCQEDREKFKGENQRNLYEEKMEVAIDRQKGNAKKGALRTIERVHPGVSFDLEIILKNDKHLDLIKKGLQLLEDSYLGGMGTRGYGHVKIENIEEKEITVDLKETA